jgi:hypothetical protein
VSEPWTWGLAVLLDPACLLTGTAAAVGGTSQHTLYAITGAQHPFFIVVKDCLTPLLVPFRTCACVLLLLLVLCSGTVPCPSCNGTPYSASLIPNIDTIFKTEVPTWQRVLGRMSR